TEPFSESISPVRIFIRVDLPAPFGPVIAYRRPEMKVVLTSSKRMRPPNRIDTLFTESCIIRMTPRRTDELLIITQGPPLHCEAGVSATAGAVYDRAYFADSRKNGVVIDQLQSQAHVRRLPSRSAVDQ